MQALGAILQRVRDLSFGAPFFVEHVVVGIVKDGEKFERRLLAEHVDYVFAALAQAFKLPDLNPLVDDRNIEDGILVYTGEAIDFAAGENKVVIGHTWRAGIAMMASAGSLRGSGERSIFVDDGEAAAVPFVVEAAGEQESGGRSFQFVDAVKHASVYEAKCCVAVAGINL